MILTTYIHGDDPPSTRLSCRNFLFHKTLKNNTACPEAHLNQPPLFFFGCDLLVPGEGRNSVDFSDILFEYQRDEKKNPQKFHGFHGSSPGIFRMFEDVLGGGNSIFLKVHPYVGKMNPF